MESDLGFDELLAQRGLLELAGRRARDRVDELEAVGQLPLGELAARGASRSSSAVASRRRAGRRRPAAARPSARRGSAITAASATAGWAISRFSRSTEEIHSPPDLTRSLERSQIRMQPRASILTTSPVVKPAVVGELVGAPAPVVARRPPTGRGPRARPSSASSQAISSPSSSRARISTNGDRRSPAGRGSRTARSAVASSRSAGRRQTLPSGAGLGHSPGLDDRQAVAVEALEHAPRHRRAADEQPLAARSGPSGRARRRAPAAPPSTRSARPRSSSPARSASRSSTLTRRRAAGPGRTSAAPTSAAA